MTVPTLEEVRTAIAMGALDEGLDHILDAVNRRRTQAFQVGTRVMFNATVRPRYLHTGQVPGEYTEPMRPMGTITKLNEKSAHVLLDAPIGKFSRGPLHGCPLTILEPAFGEHKTEEESY